MSTLIRSMAGTQVPPRRPSPVDQLTRGVRQNRSLKNTSTHIRSRAGTQVPLNGWKGIAIVAKADEEREWVRRAREGGGDAQAYRFLVERYQARIHRLVSGLIGHGHGNVEDVVQEVFVKAYFSLKKFRGDAAFGTWLYRIAVNRARDELKKESRQASLHDVISREAVQVLNGWVDQPDPEAEGPSGGPPEALRKLVGRTVASLPDRMRVIVTLKDIEGLSYLEVSRVLKCSVGTVKSRHSRARKRLREALSPYAPEFLRGGGGGGGEEEVGLEV